MATIQLDTPVVAVERLIDQQDHDEAFRQMILLREHYGRRPEYRYLQALFDSTFKVRTDREVIPQVIALVGEQPDFTEAVALLGDLYARVGERDKAEVFAREALRSKNSGARRRARAVLGLPPEEPNASPDDKRTPSAVTPPSVRPPSAGVPAVPSPPTAVAGEAPVLSRPVVMPTAGPTPQPEAGSLKRSTRDFSIAETAAPRPPSVPQAAVNGSDGWKLPSEPPAAGVQRTTLDALKVPPLPPEPGLAPGPAEAFGEAVVLPQSLKDLPPPVQDSQEVPTVRHGPSTAPEQPAAADPDITDRFRMPPMPRQPEPDDRFEHVTQPAMKPTAEQPPAVETIQFSPLDSPMPPPPTIPPEAAESSYGRQRTTRTPLPPEATTARAMRPIGSPVAVDDEFRGPSEPPTRRASSNPVRDADLRRPGSDARVASLLGEGAVDHTGIDRSSRTAKSRPAMAIPPSIEVQRQWFRYARAHQIQRSQGEAEQFSTASTLVDLAERVVEGNTPLADQPIPLDRRGLIQVEQRLEVFRRSPRPSQAATERAAVTAAAAFLLALLLKECDGRASDTSAEDGACKVALPAGATVRPLLVAAAYARSRGPGLVETFDRAATAHMRRSPTRPGRPSEPPARRQTQPPQPVSDSDLTVLRRDLDAGTLALVPTDAPPLPPPRTPMRSVASDFWASAVGREIASTSRRVGTFTLADIDALERYAAKQYGPVGFAPPGAPWPWMPPEDLDDTMFAWGAVLGEVLNSLYTGRWEADPGNPDDRLLVRVVLTGGVVAWPVAKVYLRLARGITHDLSVYVDVVGRVVGRQTLSSAAWP